MELETVRERTQELAAIIGLRGNMVAVHYRDSPPDGCEATGQVVACQAIQDARFGKTTILAKANSKCLGATYFLGFEPFSPLAYDFWVDNEQSMFDRTAAENMVQHLPDPPQGHDRYIVFEPLAASRFEPDLVLIICNPEQVSRLLGLHIFKSGKPSMIYSYGATCQTAVGIPLVTAQANVSFIDLPSRQIAQFDASEQILSLPYAQMPALLDSVRGSINGIAQPRFNYKGLLHLRGEWHMPDPSLEQDHG